MIVDVQNGKQRSMGFGKKEWFVRNVGFFYIVRNMMYEPTEDKSPLRPSDFASDKGK